MTSMSNFLLQCQFHKLLCWRTHILKSLTKWNYSKSHTFKVLNHLHCAPAVKGNFTDIILFAKLFNEFFNKAIMNYISFCSLHKVLLFPHIIRNMVTLNTKVYGFFWYPKIRQDTEFIIFIYWWKY